MKISAIIPAGGTSSRFGNKNKLLEKINGKEVILYSLETILSINEIFEVIIPAHQDLIPILKNLIKNQKVKIIQGGKVRQESVYNGLLACSSPDLVLIHDGARPLLKKENAINCISDAKHYGASILAVNSIDTIKIVDENMKIIQTPQRNTLFNVQTPQIFDYKTILNAHQKFKGENYTDDAGLLEALGIDVYVTKGDYTNIKI